MAAIINTVDITGITVTATLQDTVTIQKKAGNQVKETILKRTLTIKSKSNESEMIR